MKRTNISLTDEQYEWVRKAAFKQGKSMSEIFRSWVDTMKTGNSIMDDLKKKDSDVGKAYTDPKKISETPKKEILDEVTESMPLNPAPKPKGKK